MRSTFASIRDIKGRELERHQVKALLRKIKDRPAPVLANRAHEVIRALLNWALDQDEYGIEANVALRLDPVLGYHPYGRGLSLRPRLACRIAATGHITEDGLGLLPGRGERQTSVL